MPGVPVCTTVISNKVKLETAYILRMPYFCPIVYIGNEVVRKLKTLSGKIFMSGVRKVLARTGETGEGKWLDLSGMFVPAIEIETLTDEIRLGNPITVTQEQEKLRTIFDQYHHYAWNCCAGYKESEIIEIGALNLIALLQSL